jgi:hypothetical protein
MIHTCNPRPLGGGDKRIQVGSQYRQKVSETLFQKQARAKKEGWGYDLNGGVLAKNERERWKPHD